MAILVEKVMVFLKVWLLAWFPAIIFWSLRMNGRALLGAYDLAIIKASSQGAVDPVPVILGCGLFISKGPQIQFFWAVI